MSANWYERNILPAALDLVCGMPMMGRMRQQVVPRAHGRVLEVGIGTVLITYTLCTITNPQAALLEMRRVLAPAGKLLYCEHGRAPDASVQRWQTRLQPLWSPVAGGCQLGRDIAALLIEAGLALPDLQTRYLPGPRPFSFHYWGEAVAPGTI